jgi:transposase
MTRFIGLDVSQKMTVICVIDEASPRLWRGQCPSVPEQINAVVRRYAGDDARIEIETGAMTPWFVHELRNLGLEVMCLDARHARAALKMQINKADQIDAEGLAQIVRTGWYRAVHVKSFDSPSFGWLHARLADATGFRFGLDNLPRAPQFLIAFLIYSLLDSEKVEDIVGLYLDPPEKALVLSIDEEEPDPSA